MSCRVLKRGMESYTLNAIAEIAKAHGFTKIVGEYIPTKKNGIVKDHYEKLGFSATGNTWELDTNSYTNKPVHISLKKP